GNRRGKTQPQITRKNRRNLWLFFVRGKLLFYFRTGNDVAVVRNRRRDYHGLTWRHHDVVPADNVGELIELALTRLIDRFITFDIDVSIVFHTRSGRNQSTHDYVLFQTTQVIHASGDRGFRQHASSLLERSRRDERIGRERRLRDTKQQRLCLSNFAVFLSDALVLVLEAETIDLLFEQEFRVADFLDLHPAQHLTNNHFDVLVVDVHTL